MTATLPAGVMQTASGDFVLRDDTCLSRWVETEGTLELQANLNEIADYVSYIPYGGVVINAGACIGDHTATYARLVGSTGYVYAFEPHPIAFAALRLNVERFDQVMAVQAALSDVQGACGLKREPNVGASFLSGDDDLVSCVRLDDCFRDHVQIDLIHLDAEGWEPRIILGGRAVISRLRPALVVEVCDKHLRRAGWSESKLLALLDEVGYDVRDIAASVEPELRNVLCVPRVA